MQKSELTLKELLKGIKPKTNVFIFQKNDTEIDTCLFEGVIDNLEYSVIFIFGDRFVEVSAKDGFIRVEVLSDLRKISN